jgi:hypothetical protein
MMLAAYYTHTNSEVAGVVIIIVFALLMWVWAKRDPKPHHEPSSYLRVPVWALKEGDMVDLEDDPYADPRTDPDPQPHPIWAYEYAKVEGSEQETPDCVRIDFENGPSCGFPPEHKLRVRR